MFMESIRALLGDSLYEWSLQMGHLLQNLWNSLLAWQILCLVLFVCLITTRGRRPR
jgi:hypothetical protein